MKNNKLTYEKSGVNIKAADKFVKFISLKSNNSKNSGKFKNIGGFGSITQIPKTYKHLQKRCFTIYSDIWGRRHGRSPRY